MLEGIIFVLEGIIYVKNEVGRNRIDLRNKCVIKIQEVCEIQVSMERECVKRYKKMRCFLESKKWY